MNIKKNLPHILKKRISNDGSIKYLFRFDDGALAECVYFEFNQEKMVCISSQIGCVMGCVFCASGKYTFKRNFTVAEMLGQIKGILNDLMEKGKRIKLDSVSIQGTGEPLLNFQNIKDLADIVIEEKLAKYLSVSTTGIPRYLKQIPDTNISILFISLHATENKTRRTLIKNNKFCDIYELIELSRICAIKMEQKVIASYLILKDINDTDDDLQRLKELLNPEYFIIQICTFNQIPDVSLQRSTRSVHFSKELEKAGFETHIVESMGQDTGGGCGQMLSIYETDKKL